MNASRKRQKTGSGFTIVELLTVMSIIVLLMSIMVPALNKVKIYARDLKQRAQFHGISTALELFHSEFEDYPDSGPVDEAGTSYCGAMKLAEAMVGQDTYGFHLDSHFRADLTIDGTANTRLYDNPAGSITGATGGSLPVANARSRKLFLEIENCNPERLGDLYFDPATGTPDTQNLPGDLFVLCDVYPNVFCHQTGDKVGSPVLYYKADVAGNVHKLNPDPANGEKDFYNYLDNHELVGLPVPRSGDIHPLFQDPTQPVAQDQDPGALFYLKTQNKKLSSFAGAGPAPRPMRADSFILWSAGNDGLYGTRDDILNFKED